MNQATLATRRENEIYTKFIDKVKDRRKIVRKEYHKLIDDICEENPEFRGWSFTVALYNHGWSTRIISEGNKSDIYMVKPN